MSQKFWSFPKAPKKKEEAKAEVAEEEKEKEKEDITLDELERLKPVP